MKRILPIIIIALSLFVACLDNNNTNNDDNFRYFVYGNTIPYYFYNADSTPIIDIRDMNSFPLSYIDILPNVTVESVDSKGNLFLSNYDGIGIDSLGKCYWYCYNKGCYDSLHFNYNVRVKYNHDRIDVDYYFDTLDQYRVGIYVHRLAYNGITIRAYEEDSTKFFTAHHVDVYKYPDSTVVVPIFLNSDN